MALKEIQSRAAQSRLEPDRLWSLVFHATGSRDIADRERAEYELMLMKEEAQLWLKPTSNENRAM